MSEIIMSSMLGISIALFSWYLTKKAKPFYEDRTLNRASSIYSQVHVWIVAILLLFIHLSISID